MTKTSKTDDQKREEAVIQRMLNTPPKPKAEASQLLKADDCFVICNGIFRILGKPHKNKDGSITGTLYRNPEDYISGKAMEPTFTFRS